MKILGITGRSGSGKGYVCARFAKHGIPTIDTDGIVHALYRENEACIAELEAVFGPLRSDNGEIDRKKLGQIVFADAEKLAKLNEIVHRYVKEEIDRIAAKLEAQGTAALLIDAPQLYEAHLEGACDLVIAVKAPEALRRARICERDGITEEAADARLAHQFDDAFFESHSDIVIQSDGSADIDAQLSTVLERIGVL